MSRSSEDDRELDAETLRALREKDDLLPTSEAEVERAEASLPDDLVLPERIGSYRPRHPEAASNVRRLQQKPRIASHVVAATLGALAAAGAVVSLRPSETPSVTSAGGELVRPTPSSTSPRVPVVLSSQCERDCCAGSDCKAATEAMRACPSGIRCASCAPDNVAGGPYRLRVGSVILSEAGSTLSPLGASLELCIGASGSEATCLPALGESGGETWRRLNTVRPLQDLLTGLTLELRKRGETVPLASSKRAVSPTGEVLCKGLAIQLSDGKETLGRLSLFVEQTHFVELSRATFAPELVEKLERFDVRGIQPRIYESSRGGRERFVLVLGPVDRTDAEALRWQVLDRGLEATITHGLDFVGNPRPLK